MISQVLLAAMLASSSQAGLAPARSSYAKCLGSLMRSDLKQKTASEAFKAKLGGSCKAEEAAFRSASISVDVAAKIARAAAEQNANDEISYIRDNTVEKYETYMDTGSTPQ